MNIETELTFLDVDGILRGLMPIFLNEPKDSSFKYDFDNASVTVVNYENNQFKAELINDISHLIEYHP